RDPPGSHRLLALHPEEFAHLLIDIVGLHGEAVFGEEARIQAGSTAKIKQCGTWRRELKHERTKGGARASLRWLRDERGPVFLPGNETSRCRCGRHSSS